MIYSELHVGDWFQDISKAYFIKTDNCSYCFQSDIDGLFEEGQSYTFEPDFEIIYCPSI